jgi:NadR type nicotinamide-nucleotide adenylyltransferase
MIRVVLTGSECTGKTTLATRLAEHYGVRSVPEFVRDYAASRPEPLTFADHGPIARGQMALEDAAVARGDRLVVQDTDLLSTMVYCEHYFGSCPAWIAAAARERRPDLYLLCEIDLPWVADGVRDRGHLREEMQSLFRAAVRATGAPFVVIEGDADHRWTTAVGAIDRLAGDREASASR